MDEACHLLLGPAVAKRQVVQHGHIALGESAIRVLYELHAGAHLVGIVRHVDDRAVGVGGSLVCVVAERLQQRSREAGGQLHVLVRAHLGSLVRHGCVLHHGVSRALEKRLDAASGLLICRVQVERLLGDACEPRSHSSGGSCDGCSSHPRSSLRRAADGAAHLRADSPDLLEPGYRLGGVGNDFDCDFAVVSHVSITSSAARLRMGRSRRIRAACRSAGSARGWRATPRSRRSSPSPPRAARRCGSTAPP